MGANWDNPVAWKDQEFLRRVAGYSCCNGQKLADEEGKKCAFLAPWLRRRRFRRRVLRVRGVLKLTLIAAVCWTGLAQSAPVVHPARQRPRASMSPGGYPGLRRESERGSRYELAGAAFYSQELPVSDQPAEAFGGSPPEPVAAGADQSMPLAEGEYLDGDYFDGGFSEEYGDTCGGCPHGDCGPTWFAEAGALFLHRSTAHDQTVTQTPVAFTIAGFQFTVNVPLQSTRSFDFNFEAGLRTNIGRYLGTDLLNRDHTLEFMYYGLQEWNATHQIVSDRVESLLVDNGQLVVIRTGRLLTPFPTNVGGWNRADVHHIRNFSDFNNFEVNYRIRWRPGKDRLVGWPDGTWTRETPPSWTPSILAGLRYISLNDHFFFTSLGAIENLNTDVTTAMSGHYNTRTTNDLMGAQIGGELEHSWQNFHLAVRGKTGLFCNATQQYTHLDTRDDSGFFVLPQRDYRVAGDRLGYVGEFGFVGTWQIWPNVALKAAYDFLWVQGVSLAPEQVEFSIEAPPRLIDSGYVFFQGASIGCEVRW